MSPEEKAKRSKLIRDIIWVIIGLIFIFIFISILSPASTGKTGLWIHDLFVYSFGLGAYMLPLLAIYVVLHSIFRFTSLGTHWVILLCLIIQFDGSLFLHQFGLNGGDVGKWMGSVALKPIGSVGKGLLSVGIAFIAVMILTRLSLKEIYEFIKPAGLYLAKLIRRAGKGIYGFLTFGHGSENQENLEKAPMEKLPDLSPLEETSPDEDDDNDEEDEDEDEDEYEEDEKEPAEEQPDEDVDSSDSVEIVPPRKPEMILQELDNDSEEVKLPKARDTVETSALEDGTAPIAVPLVGTADGKPTGYEQLQPQGDDDESLQGGAYRYELPPLSLLKKTEQGDSEKSARDYSELLEETLANFGVEVKVINKVRGPTVTRYELQPAKGVKVKKVTSLANDIALALAAYSIRIEAPIPGKSAIGIEVPNHRIDPVFLRDILFKAKYKKLPVLSLALGMDITGRAVAADLLKMPHLLIAGATGSGKSVCINCVIASILYKATPYDVQMVMVDPKRVELSLFEGIPHLVDVQSESGKNIITNPKTATLALKTVSEIMDQRYEDFVALKVRNIKEYNAKADVPIPYIVVVIDELADLMMVSSSTVEQYICRIAQLGRASGIHMILATQRPSVNVITGLIKANIPSRIAFAVSSQVDSRTILDRAGADKLLGKGDMLYMPVDASDPIRLQGAFVSGDEIIKVVDFWKEQPQPDNIIPIEIEEEESGGKGKVSDDDKDALIDDAIDIIRSTRQASVSNLQRKMKIGYARAGRMMDQLEQMGIVGPADGSKPRKILIPGFNNQP